MCIEKAKLLLKKASLGVPLTTSERQQLALAYLTVVNKTLTRV